MPNRDNADRRDDLDSWLDGRVDPLPPPPGTFDLIKRRARRRKYRRLAITAGAAAVIVAAAVTVPQVVNLPVLNPTTANQAAANGRTSRAGVPSAEASPLSSSAKAAVPSPAAAPVPVPASFRPTSVTFIGTESGWVIGQAGTPGHCATQYCTSVAHTDDAGKSWTGGPAPLAGPADGATGVSQIRFLDASDGWAFGPELFATHDGGQTWTRIDTGGLRVTDLETVGHRAFALFASCTGTGTDFAGHCASYTLYSSPDAADDWASVSAATSGLTNGGRDGAATLVLTGTTGFLVAPSGLLYDGPVDGSQRWQVAGHLPCRPGKAQPDGQPAGTLLGAVDASNLVLACAKKLIYTSADGGVSWRPAALPAFDGVATSVAGSPAGNLLLGSTTGIELLPAGGTRWQQASVSGGVPAGGFGFVGMTTGTQGVAVPADPKAGAVWFTYNGGLTWVRSPISSGLPGASGISGIKSPLARRSPRSRSKISFS
jgi:photosystem II stability/assembly factor-like uncharacterized protein